MEVEDHPRQDAVHPREDVRPGPDRHLTVGEQDGAAGPPPLQVLRPLTLVGTDGERRGLPGPALGERRQEVLCTQVGPAGKGSEWLRDSVYLHRKTGRVAPSLWGLGMGLWGHPSVYGALASLFQNWPGSQPLTRPALGQPPRQEPGAHFTVRLLGAGRPYLNLGRW